jgi:hypothetical protein
MMMNGMSVIVDRAAPRGRPMASIVTILSTSRSAFFTIQAMTSLRSSGFTTGTPSEMG